MRHRRAKRGARKAGDTWKIKSNYGLETRTGQKQTRRHGPVEVEMAHRVEEDVGLLVVGETGSDVADAGVEDLGVEDVR